jgi:hypothetical protein
MCLLGLAIHQIPGYPILLLANREEAYSRPTALPQVFHRVGNRPAWLGGRDLLAGGTWLGINEFGLIAAVTNLPQTRPPANPRSRGLLCTQLLGSQSAKDGLATALAELESRNYAGCHLVVADREFAYCIEAGDEIRLRRLDDGVHVITNSAMSGTGDRRSIRVYKEFAGVSVQNAADWIVRAEFISRLTGSESEPAVCVVGADRGTVSAAVVALGSAHSDSRFLFAPGPPHVTPFDDYSPMLHQLLSTEVRPAGDTDPANRPIGQDLAAVVSSSGPSAANVGHKQSSPVAVPEMTRPAPPMIKHSGRHRILLRGPWQVEVVSRIERTNEGSRIWSSAGSTSVETARLPAAWQQLFGDFRGRVLFRRRFHPPSNIGPEDRLILTVTCSHCRGAVFLNGGFAGQIEQDSAPLKFEVMGRLAPNNELTVDLQFTNDDVDVPAAGLVVPVMLEIYSAGESA